MEGRSIHRRRVSKICQLMRSFIYSNLGNKASGEEEVNNTSLARQMCKQQILRQGRMKKDSVCTDNMSVGAQGMGTHTFRT